MYKIFRSNNAMEYKESTFLEILQQNGTLCHQSYPSISQKNDLGEQA